MKWLTANLGYHALWLLKIHLEHSMKQETFRLCERFTGYSPNTTHDDLTYRQLAFVGDLNSGYICPEFRRIAMIVVPLAEAKNNLSKLVDEAAAGQVITIAKHGRALARLVPVGKPCGQRIGAMKGKLVVPQDFDAPLPDEMLDAFEGTFE
jgi:prevent-host-death family protein